MQKKTVETCLHDLISTCERSPWRCLLANYCGYGTVKLYVHHQDKQKNPPKHTPNKTKQTLV